MKHSIDQLLSAARPAKLPGNSKFVTDTMHAVKTAASSIPLTAKSDKQRYVVSKFSRLKHKFRKLPPLISVGIIIGSTSVAAAAAYGTYQWIKPDITITKIQQSNDDGNKQYTIDSQCGAYLSGKALQFEVAKGSGLSDTDAQKVFSNSCAYDAISSFIDSHWHSDNSNAEVKKMHDGDLITIYNHSNVFAGSTTNNPVFGFTLGNITAISPTSITTSVLLYKVDALGENNETSTQYYPDGKLFTRTIAVSPNVEVWDNGKQQSLSTIHVGDQIQLVTRTQNYVKYYEDIHQNSLGGQKTFDVAGIIKTKLDTRYIASTGTTLANPQILNAISQLLPCYGNTEFLCAQSLSGTTGQLLYGAPEGGGSHLRKDAPKINSYELHGRVQSIDGDHIVLKTRGTVKTFTVDLPPKSVAKYNTTAQLKLAVGDVMAITYNQKSNENHLVIRPSDINAAQLLALTLPDGTQVKY